MHFQEEMKFDFGIEKSYWSKKRRIRTPPPSQYLAIGTGVKQRHDLVLSVMFKNSTPGVRNIEFRIHMFVGGTAGASTLTELTTASKTHNGLQGTQS